MISIKGKDKAVIILSENSFNEGWEKLAIRINSFINRSTTSLMDILCTNEADSVANKGKGSYSEILYKSK